MFVQEHVVDIPTKLSSRSRSQYCLEHIKEANHKYLLEIKIASSVTRSPDQIRQDGVQILQEAPQNCGRF